MAIRSAARVAAAFVLCAAAGEAFHGPRRPTYADVARATHDLLDRYASGDHDAAIAGIDREQTAGVLRAATEAWIQAGDASTFDRRQRVAAAFTLEAVWAATRDREVLWDFEWNNNWTKPWDTRVSDVRSVLPIVAWGCDVVSNAQGDHPSDSHWFLASVGILQDVGASTALLAYRAQPGPQPTWDPLMRRDLAGGPLVHARVHVPDEPRWKLAELLAHAERELGTPPIYQRPGVLRNGVWRREALPRIQERLASLTDDPELSAEAGLRIAYADVQRRRWREALVEVHRVLTEPFLIAVAEYLRGWASEQLGQPAAAIAAYRHALEIAPGMRNPVTLLAAQLYVANQRAEAYELLESIYANPSHPRDLIVQFERGDARLVPDFFARLRAALR